MESTNGDGILGAGQLVTCRLEKLRPHPSYLRHHLAVSASQLSALAERGDRAFLEPLQQSKHLYEFAPHRIDPARRLLLRGEESVQLPSKVFETLLVLVQRSEEVVSKDDLLKTVWPDSFVEESNLSQSIFLLRKALGETAQDHRYIVTVPGRKPAALSRRIPWFALIGPLTAWAVDGGSDVYW